MDLNQENIQKIVAQVLSEMKGTSSQPAPAAAPTQFEIPKKARVAMLTALRKIEIKEFDIPEILSLIHILIAPMTPKGPCSTSVSPLSPDQAIVDRSSVPGVFSATKRCLICLLYTSRCV